MNDISNKKKPECPICLNPITRPFYAHKNKGGDKHPFHKRCLMKLLRISESSNKMECPVCRTGLTQQNMSKINTPNTESNRANRANGVILENTNVANRSEMTRNQLGVRANQYLFFESSMNGYFVLDRTTNLPIVNNKGVARFVAHESLLPDTPRHYIKYDSNQNTHHIRPRP